MSIENQSSTAVPLDAVSNVVGANATESMSIISLMIEASLTVQFVMLLLFLASLVSWSIIFSKFFMLRREAALTAKFEKEFWAGGSMKNLYDQWGSDTKRASGMSEIFVAGRISHFLNTEEL